MTLRKMLIYAAATVLALTLLLPAFKFLVGLVYLIWGIMPPNYQPGYNVTPVVTELSYKTEECERVGFHFESGGRPFLTVMIDGKEYNALFDTGSSTTLIDAQSTGVPGDGNQDISGFDGHTSTARTALMQVCVRDLCDNEEVSIMKNLMDKAILRGAFLNRYHTATFDYRAKTISVCRMVTK